MPTVIAIGTYLRCWGTSLRHIAGRDEGAIGSAAGAGRADVRDFFTGVALISYEDLDRPTAVSAVTILEGPGADGR